MYDGVGDYSEGHVYLKDTGEEHRYGTSVTEGLGRTALLETGPGTKQR